MEKDLTVLLAERDALKHKMELEKLRDENIHLMEQVRLKIENAKTEISENAIDKAMLILEGSRKWLLYGSGIFATFIAVAGFIGYKSINEELTDYYTNTIHQWLRFDNPKSGGSKSLNDLRTTALLDSITLKYERDKASSSSIASIDLRPEERHRLMELIMDPLTDEQQYVDALHIIMINRGMYGRFREDNTGKEIASILRNKNFSNSKKLYVLDALKKDRALYPWALAVINGGTPIDDEEILIKALKNVSYFNDEQAVKFAETNINKFKSESARIELGVFLIENGKDNNNINNLIASLKEGDHKALGGNYGELVVARFKQSTSNNDTKLAAKYISDQIDDGLNIELSSYIGTKPIVSLFINNAYYPFREPETFFSNENLINSIVKEKPLSPQRLLKQTLFFQLKDRGYWVTTLMLKPVKNTVFTFNNGIKVKGSEILNHVWLRADEKAGKTALIAIWRNNDGAVKEAQLTNITGCEECHYSVDFNREQLRSYTWAIDYNYLND
ncbi:hypothetical protein [Citrobacter sp. RHBSTW-00271]|uniref:hypothetical protein n=1 Tax=Citrobacter sp. RHBSTW-00271 TaxID=2742642 RepID=UPI0015FA22E9|nr:hypothetical protein [Citrobacter sp. RHBSTW-00271]MBA7942491.1 hypothetical protein [Citrobacter sp. RHBSTW-00271]